MKAATLTRGTSTDEGTHGVFLVGEGVTFTTGELPWRDNHHGLSCIPVGTYLCKWINSPKHGMCYQVQDVPDRDMIEIHAANFSGDTVAGWESELLGCIALGKSIGSLTNKFGKAQLAVFSSRVAISEFNKIMGGEDFMLEVK